MKRPGGIKRTAFRSRAIARGSGPRPAPMPKVNARQQAKKKATYKAFMASPAWKAIRQVARHRAGYRCEQWTMGVRCPATEKLTVHHLTYARFGGAELPEDLRVLCKSCHDRLHATAGKRIA